MRAARPVKGWFGRPARALAWRQPSDPPIERTTTVRATYAIPLTLLLTLSGAPDALAEKLTGFAAWSKLVGNTVTGKVDGKEHVEYYMDNGTVKALEDSKLHTGKWVLEGANVCFTFQGSGKQCYVIEVTDDVATFSSKSHGAYRLNIVKGNAKKL
jgi:hypothetical protein